MMMKEGGESSGGVSVHARSDRSMRRVYFLSVQRSSRESVGVVPRARHRSSRWDGCDDGRARASPRGRPPRGARSVTRARDETREGVDERRRALVDVETNERVARAVGRGPTSRPTSRAGDRTARSTAGGLR